MGGVWDEVRVVRSSESHRVLTPTVRVSVDEQLMLSEGMRERKAEGQSPKAQMEETGSASQPSSKDGPSRD